MNWKHSTLVLAAAVGGALLGASLWGGRPAAASATPAGAHPEPRVIAAAGRIEPLSEEIRIGSEFDGRLARVLVEEGDEVRGGQLLAVLDNGDARARAEFARAAVEERRAVVERLRHGSRQEERREAEALLREAEALAGTARLERDRRQPLLERGAISRSEFDLAARDAATAAARAEALRERLTLVRDETRPEDLRRAEAELASAEARLREAEALLEKTHLRAPIAGRVLRRYLRAGESVSAGGSPVVSLGNLSRLRVRVDVDEDDVARLHLRQAAYVTAAAYGAQRFPGRVVRIGEALGRKNIRTEEPSERVDTKILETLIELDEGVRLPVGLRVDAFLEVRD